MYHPVGLSSCVCTQRYTTIGRMLPLHSIHCRLFVVARCMEYLLCFASRICSHDNSADALIQAFPNIFSATVFTNSPQKVHSNTLLRLLCTHMCACCLYLGWRLTNHAIFPLSCSMRSASKRQASGAHFLFGLDFRLLLPLQGLLKKLSCLCRKEVKGSSVNRISAEQQRQLKK